MLQKITKVDREIAKAESQIAKLKKKQVDKWRILVQFEKKTIDSIESGNKCCVNNSILNKLILQQELEDTTSKPLSDTNDEEEKPRNQSIAQVVYAENRVSRL